MQLTAADSTVPFLPTLRGPVDAQASHACRAEAFQKAAALAQLAASSSVATVFQAWGDADLKAGRHQDAVQHYRSAGALSKAAEAAAAGQDFTLANTLLDSMVRPGLQQLHLPAPHELL